MIIITISCIVYIQRPLNIHTKYSSNLLSFLSSNTVSTNRLRGEFPPFLSIDYTELKCIIAKARKSCAEIIQKLIQHTVRWNGMSLWGNVVPQREIIFCYLVKIAFSWKTKEYYIHLPSSSKRDKTVTISLPVPSEKIHKNMSLTRSQPEVSAFYRRKCEIVYIYT